MKKMAWFEILFLLGKRTGGDEADLVHLQGSHVSMLFLGLMKHIFFTDYFICYFQHIVEKKKAKVSLKKYDRKPLSWT